MEVLLVVVMMRIDRAMTVINLTSNESEYKWSVVWTA